jgi:hypothetical protein
MSPDHRLVPRLTGYGQRLAAWRRGVPPVVVDSADRADVVEVEQIARTLGCRDAEPEPQPELLLA